MKRWRVTLSLSAIAAVVLFIFLVPLPVSRVRNTAMVTLEPEPETAVQVTIQIPCILEKLHVRDGQLVQEGDILAEFSSLDLETQLLDATTQYRINHEQVRALEQRLLSGSLEPRERAEVLSRLATARGERSKYEQQRAGYEQIKKQLILKAPQRGIVMSPPRVEEVGKLWEKDRSQPFCTIGDPSQLRVLLPVPPADYRLLRDDLDELRENLDVTIRVQGRDARTWKGKLWREQLPVSEARTIPVQLSTRGGGPLAVKPAQQPGVLVPQAQHYLIPIEFLDADVSVCPGTLAQVKVHCKWRTSAWWLWRTINNTFDLGLI